MLNLKMNQEVSEAIRDTHVEQYRIIKQLIKECRQAITNTSAHLEDCPVTWDGMMCWPATPAGHLRYLPCPAHILGFNPHRNASKLCTAEGEWFVKASINKTWTNYSQCYTERNINVMVQYPVIENSSFIEHYVSILKAVSHVGYGVSLATLLVAFCVFATFKRLRCPRNKLHMHLFVSFMLRAFTSLLKDSLFVRGVGMPSDVTIKDGERYFLHGNQHSWQCKMIISLWQYFIMANYSWILMEGLYLHNLILFALFSDTSSILFYAILGWGLPVLFVVPWVFLRAFLENTFCWTTNEHPYYYELIKGPTTASILVNFILFLNIVRVLLSKLKASISEETRRYRYRRWAKSTLVLVPLFGVHYAVFLTMDYIGVEGRVELIWLFIDQVFASFQGFFVAILYCLLNGEVRQEVAKKWRRFSWRQRREVDQHRASLPLNMLHPVGPTKRSYLGSMFSRRRRRYQAHGNGCKRGSTATETCTSTLVSSVHTDFNTTSMPHNSQSRKSMVPDNLDLMSNSNTESQLLT